MVGSGSVARLRRPIVLRSLVLLFAVLMAPALAERPVGAQAPTPVSVALDWYPNANHAGLFLARERGFFADEGLDVELYTPADPTLVLQTVGAGRDTFGISYQTDLLLARAEEVPVVSVAAIVPRPLLGVMSLEERGIGRPRDLVGQTVGYPGIPSQEAILATMLEADGARLADVELVNVGFDLVPATISGRVDAVMGAYWTHETILAEREGYPVDLLRVEDWGVPPYYELVLVAGEATIETEPETARAFLRAMRRGYAAAAADPTAALDALADASPDVDRDVEAEGIALLVPVWLEDAAGVGGQDPSRWRTYAGWMAERGLIPADVDVDAAFDAGLLPLAATPTASGTP